MHDCKFVEKGHPVNPSQSLSANTYYFIIIFFSNKTYLTLTFKT